MSAIEVRKLREALGMTQGELAAEVGTTRVSVSQWENGVHPPSGLATKQLRRLARLVQRRGSRKKEEEG